MKLTLTLTAFAFDLGAHARLTRQVSEVWHKQYTTATPATRSAMRTEFVDAFIKGYKSGVKKSGVRNLTSDEIQRNAEMAASQKFKYHISRDRAKDAKPAKPAKPATPATPAKSMRLTKDVRALAEAYLANFKDVTEAIAALRAVAPKK